MGFILGSGKKAAKIQANATIKSAELGAQQDRFAAQAAQSATETMIAQTKAAQQAAEILAKPQAQAEVQLGPDVATPEIDPNTGRRKSVRSTYQTPRKSGINIP